MVPGMTITSSAVRITSSSTCFKEQSSPVEVQLALACVAAGDREARVALAGGGHPEEAVPA